MIYSPHPGFDFFDNFWEDWRVISHHLPFSKYFLVLPCFRLFLAMFFLHVGTFHSLVLRVFFFFQLFFVLPFLFRLSFRFFRRKSEDLCLLQYRR